MLDLTFVRGNPKFVEEKLRARGPNAAAPLKDFRENDQFRRKAITQVEQKKAQLNVLSQQVGALKKAGEDASLLVGETRSLKSEIDSLEKIAAAFDQMMRDLLEGVPNLTQDWIPSPDPDVPSKAKGVPKGDSEKDNIVVRTWCPGMSEKDSLSVKAWGEPLSLGFEPKPHWELGEELRILDLDRAAKLSGARFAVYMGAGARLERALISFMLDFHTKPVSAGGHGYKEVLPPFMVNSKSLLGTGQLPKFAEDLFRCADADSDGQFEAEQEYEKALTEFGIGSVRAEELRARVTESKKKAIFNDHWLIPTAEVPVTNLFRDEILDDARLPIAFTAYTPCFRAEAGAAGRDTRGIIRQHQFQKVELVKFVRPEDSDAEHERLTRDAEEILEALALPYRRVLLCTADTGFSSAKTFDLEVWLPGQQLYREISSCSNFEAFQARRANIRYRPVADKTSGDKAKPAKTKPEFVHTLNGSGLAVGRTWLAILENYQQADGSVLVPEVLKPYMGGMERIVKEV